MTKEEAQKLYIQSELDILRMPNCLLNEDKKSVNSFLKQLCGLFYFKNLPNKPFLERAINTSNCKESLKNHPFVKKLKGRGTRIHPYKIRTIFGDGEFFDMHYIFKTHKFPDFVKKNFCYGNCMIFSMVLAKENTKSTVLSGISYFDKPFLHAVMQVNYNGKPKIIDFNYDLIMDKDLYLKLFSFEVLAKVTGQKLLDAKDLIQGEPRLNDYHLLLAYDDCIRLKKEVLAQRNGEQNPPQENAQNNSAPSAQKFANQSSNSAQHSKNQSAQTMQEQPTKHIEEREMF